MGFSWPHSVHLARPNLCVVINVQTRHSCFILIDRRGKSTTFFSRPHVLHLRTAMESRTSIFSTAEPIKALTGVLRAGLWSTKVPVDNIESAEKCHRIYHFSFKYSPGEVTCLNQDSPILPRVFESGSSHDKTSR